MLWNNLPLVVYMKDEEISSLVKTKDISNFFLHNRQYI